jgi:hypothetical protein
MLQTQNIMLKPVAGKLSLIGILAIAGIAGPLILITAELVTGLSSPEYNFTRDSISSLVWATLG